MQRIMVLGANGYLGSHTCKALKDSGYYVIGVGRAKESNLYMDSYVQLDLTDPNAITILNTQIYDAVVDLISYVLPNNLSIKTEEMKLLLHAYAIIVKACFVEKKYIFISSGGTVYGNVDHPCTEEHPLNPLTPYALQKVYQEEIIKENIEKHIILRVSNPYGGNQVVKNGVGFVASVIQCLKNDLPIRLTVPRDTTRDYIEINDVTKGILLFLKLDSENVVVNISSGFGTTLQRIIDHYSMKYSRIAKIEDVHDENRNPYIPYNVLSNDKLLLLTSLKPKKIFDL